MCYVSQRLLQHTVLPIVTTQYSQIYPVWVQTTILEMELETTQQLETIQVLQLQPQVEVQVLQDQVHPIPAVAVEVPPQEAPQADHQVDPQAVEVPVQAAVIAVLQAAPNYHIQVQKLSQVMQY